MKWGDFTQLVLRLLRDEFNYFGISCLCPLKYKLLQLHVSAHVFLFKIFIELHDCGSCAFHNP